MDFRQNCNDNIVLGIPMMTWEEMYNNALETIYILNKEVETLRAIVRVQLPIIEGKDDENIQSI